MVKKYNLALIPICKSNEVIAMASELSYMADSYLLGLESLPHVTLYQFHADDCDINSIWDRTRSLLGSESIDFTFKEFSCVTFDSEIFWVSLLPDQVDLLRKMHEEIARAISLPVNNEFDPHMTLINTKNKECEIDIVNCFANYQSLMDKFKLSLGISDEIGQFKKLIHS